MSSSPAVGREASVGGLEMSELVAASLGSRELAFGLRGENRCRNQRLGAAPRQENPDTSLPGDGFTPGEPGLPRLLPLA